MKNKVFVGLSGGVDSAVCAYLLKEKGFDVTAVFMKNWSGEDYGVQDQCPWEEDLKSAKEVAKHLGIELLVYNFEKEYREAVVSDFFLQYSLGNTPNPDVLCNKYIKFSAFLNRALENGADYIATGHYAKSEGSRLFNAKDRSKDQTYFLHQLSGDQISKSIFPLGDLLKSEVREIALEAGLPNAKRKDSQGICFIGKIDVVDFLKNEIKEKEGDIVDYESGKVVGKHNGVWYYTVGQRHGLGIGGSDIPYFVHNKDVLQNIIYVVKGKENPLLYKTKVEIKDLNQIVPISEYSNLVAQIRYRGHIYNIEEINISKDDSKAEKAVLTFSDKVWAPALGQSVVIYSNSECLGGGVISKIID